MADNRSTTRRGSRRRFGVATALSILLGALASLAPAGRAGAEVSGITSSGSIVYIKDNDVWLTSPDGANQRRLTTDGNTDTPDFTGSNGYDSPSQSDSGDVIVATRREGRTGDLFRADGYLWVLNRQGEVIRKFKPQQGIRFGNTLCSELVVAPRGIIDAAVSPDGTKIAYVSQWNFHHPDCPRVVEHTQLWVVNIDGTNNFQITSDADLDGPSWLSNSRLLMNTLASNRTHFADLPGTVATDWTWGGGEPDLRAGKLASHGLNANWSEALFLLTSGAPPAEPVFRCGYGAPSGGSDAAFQAPSWSPDASALTWEEGDGVADEAGEGVWVMAVGDLAVGCPVPSSAQLLVPGGRQPDWGPAAMTALPPTSLAVNDVTLSEGDSGTKAATFTITRSGGTGRTSSVKWATADGTATAPADYQAVPLTTVTFGAGETTKAVSVTINGDTSVEPEETFSVRLSAPVGATIADGTGLGRITNDDVGSFSVNDATVVEGNSGTKQASFTISRTGAVAGPASVRWATLDAQATAGSDYVGVAPTTVDFGPGETTKEVSVTVNGDTAMEINEIFYVRLSAPVGATVADGSGTGRITNDDVATVSINDVAVTEGDEGTRLATFTITRSGALGGPSSIRWLTAEGTTTAGSDYVAVPATTVDFGPGETTKTASVTVNGDTAVEANEVFYIRLTAPVMAVIGDGTGAGRITNDDTASFFVNDVTVAEGNSATTPAAFTITRTGAVAGAASVQWYTTDGTAVAPGDYLAVAATTVNFAPGETAKTVTVSVNGDITVEPSETFSVRLKAAVGGTIVDPSGLGRINNDD